ncbi:MULTISPECIES: hypothetical protein [Pseudoalteromonas]|uniref:hypothetical protein n=1 Tax=Pseudoalteromonas TaxID=53246 RepID=UPI000A7D5749|nr:MULTISPECIES: hypothetical protein [Pseudoalteromonas]
MAKIILNVDVPENVSAQELEEMALFKFMGHAIDSEVASKFKHEEFDVIDFEIQNQ